MNAPQEARLTVEAIIDALEYDFTHFDIDHFQRYIEGRRGRPLNVRYASLAPELFGFWYPIGTTDYIVVNANLLQIHRIHTLLHEIAHMVLGHHGTNLDELLGKEFTEKLAAGAGEGHLRSSTTIADTQSDQEREAELFVLLIQRKLVSVRKLHELFGEPTSIVPMQPFVRGFDVNS